MTLTSLAIVVAILLSLLLISVAMSIRAQLRLQKDITGALADMGTIMAEAIHALREHQESTSGAFLGMSQALAGGQQISRYPHLHIELQWSDGLVCALSNPGQPVAINTEAYILAELSPKNESVENFARRCIRREISDSYRLSSDSSTLSFLYERRQQVFPSMSELTTTHHLPLRPVCVHVLLQYQNGFGDTFLYLSRFEPVGLSEGNAPTGYRLVDHQPVPLTTSPRVQVIEWEGSLRIVPEGSYTSTINGVPALVRLEDDREVIIDPDHSEQVPPFLAMSSFPSQLAQAMPSRVLKREYVSASYTGSLADL